MLSLLYRHLKFKVGMRRREWEWVSAMNLNRKQGTDAGWRAKGPV